MTAIIQGDQVRAVSQGIYVQKATGTLTDVDGVALFVVTGLVKVTSLVGVVTTAITVANSYTLLFDPDLGTSTDLAAAVDLGTTDTAAGEILVAELDGTALAVGNRGQVNPGVFLYNGQIEHNSNGTDGAITWHLTYVPISTGAGVVAA
jgi:hypothetical protein